MTNPTQSSALAPEFSGAVAFDSSIASGESAAPTLAESAMAASSLQALADEIQHDKASRRETSTAARRLRHLSQIGVALSAERDIRRLLAMILSTSRELTASDGGTLYIVEPDANGAKSLYFRASQNDSIVVDTNMSFVVGANSLAGYAALSGEVLRFDDVYNLPPGAPFKFNPLFDLEHDYRTKSVLVVPLKNHVGEVIGVLQLINRKRRRDTILSSPEIVEREVSGFDDDMMELASTLASQAAVALNNNLLLQEIETLFESLVEAASSAIETRDPSTSGHSRRVTNLTLELARAVSLTTDGPLSDVRFAPTEMKELRYACLLHDFGKIGVREAVLTKSHKIVPAQFAEIRARALALQRQWEGECAARGLSWWRAGAPDAALKCESCEAENAARVAQLRADFAAVEVINDPMQEPHSEARWSGARAAITRLESLRYQDASGQEQPILSAEEANALRVTRGTLTPAEFRQIQEHAQMSFEFLEQIPWTGALSRVPSLARSHHERGDGSGYPQGLPENETPLGAQLMAIADVYDALTASDRPYKRAMPTEKALRILCEEAQSGKLNAAALDVFIEREVYRAND